MSKRWWAVLAVVMLLSFLILLWAGDGLWIAALIIGAISLGQVIA